MLQLIDLYFTLVISCITTNFPFSMFEGFRGLVGRTTLLNMRLGRCSKVSPRDRLQFDV